MSAARRLQGRRLPSAFCLSISSFNSLFYFPQLEASLPATLRGRQRCMEGPAPLHRCCRLQPALFANKR